MTFVDETSYEGPRPRAGRGSTLRYDLVMSEEDGGLLRLTRDNVKVLEANGKDATAPEMQRATSMLDAQFQVLSPALLVKQDSEFVGVEDWDGFADRLEDVWPKLFDDPNVARMASRLTEMPVMQQAAEAKAADLWNAWVGTWVDLQLEPGEALELEGMVEFGGAELTQDLVYEHLGEEPEMPGKVRLRLRTTMEGPEVSAALGAMAAELVRPFDAEKASEVAGETAAFEMRVVGEVVAVTDPRTLRPAWVTMSKRVETNTGGSRIDEQRWEFTWR